MVGHPQYGIRGHCRREVNAWVIYLAKRVPDIASISENSTLPTEELKAAQEEYGKDVLVMFYPFRKLSDIFDSESSWWDSYLTRRDNILKNTKSATILGNMQNYYDTFCCTSLIPFEDNSEKCQTNNEPENEEDDIDIPLDDNNLIQESELDSALNIRIDPFIQQISKYICCPLSLTSTNCCCSVSNVSACEAIRQRDLNRMNDQTYHPDLRSSGDKELSNNLATRIDLLEDLIKALDLDSSRYSFYLSYHRIELKFNGFMFF